MRTQDEWVKVITGRTPDGEAFLILRDNIGFIQQDARADLLERIKSLEQENFTLQACLKDDCDNEALLKTEALKVLPPIQVEGDSNGVPSVADVGQSLVARIKALEGELSLANDCVKGLEGSLEALEGELAQAHAALNLAHSALLLFKPSKHQWSAHSNALAAIKACGVETP